MVLTCTRSAAVRLLFLFGPASCSPPPIRFHLDLPPGEPGSGVLLLGAAGDGRPTLYATELGDAEPGAFGFESEAGEEGVSVFAAVYDASLSALGLTDGPQKLGAGRTPPLAMHFHRAQFSAERASGWVEVPSPPPEIAQLQLEQTFEQGCATAFSPRLTTLELPGEDPETGTTGLGVPLADGSALIGTAAGQLFHLASGLVTRLDALSSSDGARSYFGGARSPSGEVWLIRDDAILRGDLTRGFTTMPRFRGEVLLRAWLAIRVKNGVEEALSLTDTGVIERFDGVQWRTVGEVPVVVPFDLTYSTGGVLWREGSDQALAITPLWYTCPTIVVCGLPADQPLAVWSIDGDDLSLFKMLPAGQRGIVTPSPSALIETARGEVLVSTLGGQVLRVDGPEVETVVDGTSPILGLTATPFGQLLALTRDEIGIDSDVLGRCPNVSLPGDGGARVFLPIAGGYAILKSSDLSRGRGGHEVTVLQW